MLENVSERDKNDTIVLLDFKNLSKVVAYDVSLPRRLRLHRECMHTADSDRFSLIMATLYHSSCLASKCLHF